MRRVRQFIGIVLILVTLTILGIYAFTPRHKLLSYVVPKIKFVKISKLQVQGEQATLQLHLQATSPWLPVFISKLQYNFDLYDQNISQGSQTLTTKSKGKLQPITLPIRFNYAKVRPILQRQLSDNLPVNARFQLHCQIPFFGMYNVSSQELLPFTIPVLVTPEIINLQTEEIGFQHLQLVLTVQVTNLNKFDFYLRDLSASVKFPDYQAEANNLRQNYLVKADEPTRIKIPLAKTITKNAKKILFEPNSTLIYNFNTTMVLEPVNAAVEKITFRDTRVDSVKISPEN